MVFAVLKGGEQGPRQESGREDQGKTGAPQLRLCREVRESGIEGPREKRGRDPERVGTETRRAGEQSDEMGDEPGDPS